MKLGPIHSYFINDNDKPGGRYGSILRQGRYIIRFGELFALNWSWNFWANFCGLTVDAGMRDTYEATVHVAFPPVSLWFTVESSRLLRWLPLDPVSTGIRIFGGSIWWDLWHPTMSWTSGTPWYRTCSLNPMDLLFGRRNYSEKVIKEPVAVEIPMPEGSYPGTVKIVESSWKRPRSPFTLRRVGVDVNIPDGVPIPGKGTESYNCGEDAIYGESCRATTVHGAVSSVVASALRSRERYGGSVNWRPEAAKEADLA